MPLLCQLRPRLLAAFVLLVLSVERASAWVSTSPEGDITIRGDAEVRQPHTTPPLPPSPPRSAAEQPSEPQSSTAFRLNPSSVARCLRMPP